MFCLFIWFIYLFFQLLYSNKPLFILLITEAISIKLTGIPVGYGCRNHLETTVPACVTYPLPSLIFMRSLPYIYCIAKHWLLTSPVSQLTLAKVSLFLLSALSVSSTTCLPIWLCTTPCTPALRNRVSLRLGTRVYSLLRGLSLFLKQNQTSVTFQMLKLGLLFF